MILLSLLPHTNPVQKSGRTILKPEKTTKDGLVTFTLERNSVIVVFKNVPAKVCENCGDFYLTSETTQMLLEKANQTLEKGVEFEIINLKPAA